MTVKKKLELDSVFQTIFRIYESREFVSFMAFFDGFLCVPPTRPLITMPIFMQMIGVEVVHISCKFCLHLTCNSRVFILQEFSQQLKVPFQGGFSNVTPPLPRPHSPSLLTTWSKDCATLTSDAMRSNALDIFKYYRFYSILKKRSKLEQKTHFVACFQKFLDHAHLCPIGDALILGQMKGDT